MSTTRSTRSAARSRGRTEDGSGLLPTVAGVLVFLILLLLAVQVIFNLYATSAVTAAAFDAARVVAGADAGDRELAADAATEQARDVLGRYGERARFEWAIEGEFVELHVVTTNPSFLPVALRRPLGLDTVDRRVRVRVEELQ